MPKCPHCTRAAYGSDVRTLSTARNGPVRRKQRPPFAGMVKRQFAALFAVGSHSDDVRLPTVNRAVNRRSTDYPRTFNGPFVPCDGHREGTRTLPQLDLPLAIVRPIAKHPCGISEAFH